MKNDFLNRFTSSESFQTHQGNKVANCYNSSVLFTKGNTGNFIDHHVRTFRGNPGPGTYQMGAPGLDLDGGEGEILIVLRITLDKRSGIQFRLLISARLAEFLHKISKSLLD
jgi:hypothetical protein